MPIKKILLLIACLFFLGCETTKMRAGSDHWHKARIVEIQEAYENKEIDKAEYLELKNEADDVRAKYLSERKSHSHIGVGYHDGAHVGVGVGF